MRMFMCLMLGLTGAAWGATESMPPLAGGTVTVPYSELRALWEAAQPKPEPAVAPSPVAAVVTAAEYHLACEDGAGHLTVEYRLQTFRDGWVLVPLMGGEARLEGTETEVGTVVWDRESYCYLAEGRGERTVRLRFVLAWPEQAGRSAGIRIAPAAATLNRLRVTGPIHGKRPSIQGLAPTEVTDEGAVYFFPASGGEVRLLLEGEELKAPTVPSIFEVYPEVLVRYEDGRLRYRSRVHAQAAGGSGLSLELGLPPNARVLEVKGEDLVSKRPGSAADGQRRLALEWGTSGLLDRMFEVVYEVPQSPLATNWVLRAPQRVGGEAEPSLFVIARVEGLELIGAGMKSSVQSRRLPEWMRAEVDEFLTVEGVGEVELAANWLPQVETAQATAKRADYRMRLVADGSMLVEGELTVQHTRPLAWRVQLPTAEQILTCQVNGQAVQPIRRGENELEFFLSGGTDGGTGGGTGTRVSFCYASRGAPLDPVAGHQELRLPQTGLFIHELLWHLTLPEPYEITALEGNVEISRKNSGTEGGVLDLRKELVRGEEPAVEVYYQRRGLE